jgi:alkylated DNA repair dioxygenase AlkB
VPLAEAGLLELPKPRVRTGATSARVSERVFVSGTLAVMQPVFQPSLLDNGPEVGLSPLHPGRDRTPLSQGAWVEARPDWVSGSDQLFNHLLEVIPWSAERRRMYDRILDVPRLVSFYDENAQLPDPALEAMRAALSEHYWPEIKEPFATVGLCLYRDGSDSVAWHGDTIGRGSTDDTLVAIVSLGAPRSFLLRPRGGGTSRRFEVGRGDLLVMGGSCQRTWEHSVPKRSRTNGPRISIQFRPAGVR